MKIYLAGPLFTAAEQEFNRQLRNLLESSGHEVWLPQEHEPRERRGKPSSKQTLLDSRRRK